MMLPPQPGLEPPLPTTPTCQGIELASASLPPTILPATSATPHAKPAENKLYFDAIVLHSGLTQPVYLNPEL